MMIFLAFLILAIAGAVLYRVAVVAFMWALWYTLTHLGLVAYVAHHPWQTAAYVSGYFLVGAGWSIAKWWFSETNAVREAKDRFDRGKAPTVGYGDKNRPMTWDEYRNDQKTNLAYSKPDIMFWIGAWPISALWTLLDDPIRRLCRRIYHELQGVYQRITDHVWNV